MATTRNAHGPTAAVRADRAVGAVMASAAGDALGAAYEFGPPLADHDPVVMKGGGGFGWAPGEWTDDTQMALAVLTPLAEGAVGLDAVETGFRAWYDSGPADVGNQTRAVLASAGRLGDVARAYQARNPHSAGNGSLMRTGPVALAAPGDRAAIAALATSVSELTHPHPDCVDACVLWSLAIDTAIDSAIDSASGSATTATFDWAEAVRAGLEFVPADRRQRWAGLIDEAASSSPRVFAQNGWVVHAFQAALASLIVTPVPDEQPCRHLQAALATAVRCGGDTDTVGAIAGSLAGARWGATALPLAWRRLLHGRRTYDHAALPAADLDTLARLAANGGQPDQHGWPGVRTLVDHYEHHDGTPPMVLGVEGARFGNYAGLAGALADGAETVVSLCRTGTHDVPTHVEHVVIGLHDTKEADNPNLAFVLTEVADTISADVAEGRSVYVHCVAAQNRTPTAAAAYLIRRGDQTVDGALAAVGKALGRRPADFLIAGLRQLTARPSAPDA